MKLVNYQPVLTPAVTNKIVEELQNSDYEVKNVKEKVEMGDYVYGKVMTPNDFLHQREKTVTVELKLACGLYVTIEGTERCY